MEDAHRRFRLSVHPSPTLALGLCAAYAGAAICLLSLDLGSGIKTFMLGFLILSGYCDLLIHLGGHRRRRLVEIILHRDDDWRLMDGDGNSYSGIPVSPRLLHPLAVCFSLRPDSGKHFPVVILKDMCAPDAFRQLRAWLNVHGEGAQRAVGRSRPRWTIGRHDGFQS